MPGYGFLRPIDILQKFTDYFYGVSILTSVAVAMSGGVDSSVAALLLKREGYDVIGIHLKLFDAPPDDESCFRSCCSIESAERARSVCNKIGARFYVLNYREKFREHVIEPFAQSYVEGRTPNPCVACNRWIKFEILLKQIRAMDVDSLATGHYIRKIRKDNTWELHRAKDKSKDQTYFLYMLTQPMLKHILFPNGDYEKTEIRRIAYEAGLPVHDTPESQEICFALTDSYVSVIKTMYPESEKEGIIVDRDGSELGHHRGIIHYTVGQRHGLGISARSPLYVLKIKPEENVIVVGTREQTFSEALVFNNETFVSGHPPSDGESVDVQIRYNAEPVRAVFDGKFENGFKIKFMNPQPAVTPGQAVVLYDDDTLLGGGTILQSMNQY
jgi:tRNA-specific 2-thiouridylase